MCYALYMRRLPQATRVFDLFGDGEDEFLLVWTPDDLHADRQSLGGNARGHFL